MDLSNNKNNKFFSDIKYLNNKDNIKGFNIKKKYKDNLIVTHDFTKNILIKKEFKNNVDIINNSINIKPFSFKKINNEVYLIGTTENVLKHNYIAKLKNKKVVWKKKGDYHHWFDLHKKNIYTIRQIDKTISFNFDECSNKGNKVFSDVIDILDSSNGKIKQSIDLYKTFKESKYFNILSKSSSCDEIFHLNFVHYIKNFKNNKFTDGDILLSSRSLSSIFVINIYDKKLKWLMRDLDIFKKQHNPIINSNGNIVLFSNYDVKAPQQSKIVEIDVDSKKNIGSYNGNQNHKFFSGQRGYIQEIGENKYLITSSNQGEVFELVCRKSINSNCKTEIVYFFLYGNIKSGISMAEYEL